MSRGPGKIERAIEAILDAEPDGAFSTEELAERVYEGVPRIEKRHRVAILRAVAQVAERRDSLRSLRAAALGGQMIIFNCLSVPSYALARIKADVFGRYSRDYRVAHRRKPEEELRAKIDGDEHYRDLVAEGGAWWRHVESWREEIEARRAGDTAHLEEILAERRGRDAAIRRSLGG